MILIDRIRDYFRDYFACLREQKEEADRIKKGREFNQGKNQVKKEEP